MSKFFRASLLAASVLVSGCAIRPLPEDVSGVPTYTIVRQIRCETRQAVIDSTIRWLISERTDPESRALGFKFKDGVLPIQAFRPALFKGRVRNLLALFYDTGVAYHFELEGTENNNVGAQIDLLKPFTMSKFTMGIGATADRQRQNTRFFSATDKFSELYQMPNDYCVLEGEYNHLVGKNYIYPITGKIGVERHVQDFVEMTLFAGLVTRGKESGPPTLVDQLEFETTISNTLTPKLEFTPVGTALNVTGASLTSLVKRKDRHKITMGLAVGGPGAKLLGPIRSTYFSPLVGTVAQNSEQRALEAVNQALTLKLFSRIQLVLP
jgi:hypothetical protein